MKLATIEDKPLIEEMIKANWGKVSDDYSSMDSIYYDPAKMFSYLDDGFLATAYPITHVIADCHIISTNIDTVRLTLEAIDLIRTGTTIRSLMAHIPKTNERCIKFVAKIGFTYLGVNRRSFKKNGELIDQHVYTRCL